MFSASMQARGSGMKLFPVAVAIAALVCSLASASGASVPAADVYKSRHLTLEDLED
jgi:hypothetical protein